jgi:hypothetical protein
MGVDFVIKSVSTDFLGGLALEVESQSFKDLFEE